ncbi:MAG: lipopolysaccharide biosynthesis protein [Geminicoccaceae bacterium]
MSVSAFGRVAVLGIARGAASGFGLLAVVLIARALPPDQLGRWSLALAVQGYALHLGEFGLRSAVTTEAGRAGRRLPELLARYFRLRLLMSALAVALIVAGCAAWRPADLQLVTLAGLSILPIALQLDWLALVDGRIWLASGLLVVRPLIFLLLVALWPDEPAAEEIAVCFLVAWMVAAASSWFALRRPVADLCGTLCGVSRMLRRGACLAGVTIGNQLQLSADLLVVGWALGATAAGDYWLASQVLVAGLLFANAAGQLALARLPGLADDPARFGSAVLREGVGILAVALAGAAMALLAAPALPPLLGAEHAGVAAILPWLLPWFVLQHPTTVLQAALTACGGEKAVLRANLLGGAALLLALGAALMVGSLPAFALARCAAEIVRLAVLILALPSAARWLPRPQTSISA